MLDPETRVDPSSGREAEMSGGIWDTSKWVPSFAHALRLFGERRPSRARPYGRRRHRSLFSSRIAQKRDSEEGERGKGRSGAHHEIARKLLGAPRPAFRFSGIILWSVIFNLNFNTERGAHDASSPCPILPGTRYRLLRCTKVSIRSMGVGVSVPLKLFPQ